MVWSTRASDTARSSAAAAYDSSANVTYAIDGATGGTGSTGVATVTGYSFGSDAWSSLTSDVTRIAPGGAYDSSANVTYRVEGATANVGQSDLTAYSNGSNAWSSLAADIVRRNVVAAYDSSANVTYAIDGETGSGTYTSANNAYSNGSNAWTSLATDTARGFLAGAYDSNANVTYAIDGFPATAVVNGYSNGSNAWSSLAADVSRYRLRAAYDSGANLTYALSGNASPGGDNNAATSYSHGSNAWSSMTTIPGSNGEIAAAAYDSSAKRTYAIDGSLVAGGETAVVQAWAAPEPPHPPLSHVFQRAALIRASAW